MNLKIKIFLNLYLKLIVKYNKLKEDYADRSGNLNI